LDQSPCSRIRSTRLARLSRRSALARSVGGGLAAGVLLGGGARGAAARSGTETATTEATVRQAIGIINDVLDGGDVAALERVFAPEYVNRTPRRPHAGGQPYAPTLAGLQAALTDLRAAVPDAVLIVEEVIAADDRAAVRVTFRGTVPATAADTGQTISYPVTVGGVAIVHVRDRQIVASWDYDEFAELFGGLFARPAAPEEEPAMDARGERREIADVTAVSVQGIGTLRLTQGDTESLTIEAEPRVLRRIATEVRDGTLFIRPDRSLRTREPIVYHLTVEDLDAIELSGAVEAEANQFATDELRLALSGSSAFAIGDLTADALTVTSNGNGSVSLGGSVGTQTVDLSGSGRYLAADLQSEEASLTVSGAGQAEVRVSDRLAVDISGAGSVVYYGNPEITQSISGAGSLRQAG
jgi:predicted ester cyclase